VLRMGQSRSGWRPLLTVFLLGPGQLTNEVIGTLRESSLRDCALLEKKEGGASLSGRRTAIGQSVEKVGVNGPHLVLTKGRPDPLGTLGRSSRQAQRRQ